MQSNEKYSGIVAAKRRKRGLTRGGFARRSDVQVMQVHQHQPRGTPASLQPVRSQIEQDVTSVNHTLTLQRESSRQLYKSRIEAKKLRRAATKGDGEDVDVRPAEHITSPPFTAEVKPPPSLNLRLVRSGMLSGLGPKVPSSALLGERAFPACTNPFDIGCVPLRYSGDPGRILHGAKRQTAGVDAMGVAAMAKVKAERRKAARKEQRRVQRAAHRVMAAQIQALEDKQLADGETPGVMWAQTVETAKRGERAFPRPTGYPFDTS
jgi:hypothetical protein